MKKIILLMLALAFIPDIAQAATIWGATSRAPATSTMRFPVDTSSSSGPGYLSMGDVLTYVSANLTGGGGSGTVNSGTLNQQAYYAATGTAVSGNSNFTTTSAGLATIGASTSTAASLAINTNINGGLYIKSSNTNGAGIDLDSTTGTHFAFFSTGSANSAGFFGIYNATLNSTIFSIYGGSSQTAGVAVSTTSTGVYGWTNNSLASTGVQDAAISRINPAIFGFGNGTQSDISGTIQARYIQANGNVSVNIREVTAAGTITFVSADSTVVANKTTGAATSVILPACTTALKGLILTVKDGKGDANTNNITVTAASANTIDSAASDVITTNKASVQYQCGATAGNYWKE